ncbi:MAG: serine--tRNA ligase [Chlorobiales bacterium]|nr:serine--tRNA ligase [Chlorobiales bacterium]
MLDRKFIRENPDVIRQALSDRHSALVLDSILEKESRKRELTTQAEKLKAERNVVSEAVGKKKSQGADASAEIETSRQLGDKIKVLTEQLDELETALNAELLRVPNLPHASVPRGADADANQEVRRWGTPPALGFTPKPHWELGEQLGVLDFERATKITGARFVVYKGAGARLERALIQFMLDTDTQEGGYVEIFPPLMVNRASMTGTGQLPNLENDVFRIRDEDLFLIPTAEVPVTNLHRDEMLKLQELPIKYAAYTPCFRKEAGSYGKDTKGIVRQHQFNKVELVKITTPETSYAELETLVGDAEKLLQRLGLHYRVMLLSTGDISFAAAKCYDLEVWHAGVGRFWEVSSCSNFEDFQARRANIRFKDQEQKTRFCHTLNGSGLATSRLLPAILENYQQPDGSIEIPEVLQPYVGGKKKIGKDGNFE